MTLFSSQDSKPKADKLKNLLDQKDIIVMLFTVFLVYLFPQIALYIPFKL